MFWAKTRHWERSAHLQRCTPRLWRGWKGPLGATGVAMARAPKTHRGTPSALVSVVHSSFIGRVTGDSKRSNGSQHARLGSRSETGGPPCLACQRSTARRWPSARVAVPSSPMQASPWVPRTVLEPPAAPRTHVVHCKHHASVRWVRHQGCPRKEKQTNVPTCTLVTL